MDSRLIVSGLSYLGYKDLIIFSYGHKGNFESVASQNIANKLGYQWEFVELTHKMSHEEYFSESHKEYLDFADTGSSIQIEHEFIAVKVLKEKGIIAKDAVVVNGNSGDYITGNHIPFVFEKSVGINNSMERMDIVLRELINKHYSLWGVLKTEENIERVENILRNEIEMVGGLPEDSKMDFGVYEFSEWNNRQSRHVTSLQRIYEYHELEWRLPLWDNDYLDFWEKIPLELKLRRSLLKEMLEKEDWGGVWKDWKTEIYTTPTSIYYLRLFVKIFFVLFGKEAWHKFDKRVFRYPTEILCKMGVVPYSKVVFDKKGYRNVISYLAEMYLGRKGLKFNGKPYEGEV